MSLNNATDGIIQRIPGAFRVISALLLISWASMNHDGNLEGSGLVKLDTSMQELLHVRHRRAELPMMAWCW
ncbi:hypothetical protein BJB45_06550 [Halomonas huangheensis]|uniref:Uncharacterized protein n=1 Tax=Halomonas huangheensis TaxID=1178482 RepID=W1N3A0_9GAMM|nr:hypothetical protein AR456_07895 [Halomonas huangheensis]ERL49435.1 hypothetical protein BJB45_06550 [Halomonas huangheensis]